MYEAIQSWGAERAMQILLWVASESLRASLLISVAALVALLARNAAAQVRHILWGVALAGVIAIPMMSSALPKVQLFTLSGGSSASVSVAPSPPVATTEPVVYSPMAAVPASASVLATPTKASVTTLTFIEASKRVLSSVHWSIWVVSYSGIVTFLALLMLVTGFVRVRRLGSASTPFDCTAVASALDATATTRRIRCIIGPVSTPMTWGLIWPTIALPESAREWSHDRLHMVLVHELTHIQRGDYALRLMARVICALYWFNPLMWYASHRLTMEGEMACDNSVITDGVLPSRYAQELLDVAQVGRRSYVPAAAITMARRSQLEGRLMSILEKKPRSVSRKSLFVPIALAMIMVSIAVVEPWGFEEKRAARAPKAPRAPRALSAPPAPRAPRAYSYNDFDEDGNEFRLRMRGNIAELDAHPVVVRPVVGIRGEDIESEIAREIADIRGALESLSARDFEFEDDDIARDALIDFRIEFETLRQIERRLSNLEDGKIRIFVGPDHSAREMRDRGGRLKRSRDRLKRTLRRIQRELD